jgi:hypothetical protein
MTTIDAQEFDEASQAIVDLGINFLGGDIYETGGQVRQERLEVIHVATRLLHEAGAARRQRFARDTPVARRSVLARIGRATRSLIGSRGGKSVGRCRGTTSRLLVFPVVAVGSVVYVR